MPISMLHLTRQAIGNDAASCTSRSLFLDKFADPLASEKTTPTRKEWFDRLIKKPAEDRKATSWLPTNGETLHARLQSRLMLNMAGGVMENAGLLLDRYGLPYIPGSASKACARRIALQALHDWVEVGTERPSAADIAAPCCEAFVTPEEMLVAIAQVFGWVRDDWKTGKNRNKNGEETTWKSDFVWAVGGDETILSAARQRLPKTDAYAGTIAFLPAHPNADPGLELDVVTPHHTAYYQSTDPAAVATDTEDPVPVFFPAVKPQKEADYFTFALMPLRRAKADSLTHAKIWLRHGLETFGLGAKTNAGYGWFEVIDETKIQEAQKQQQLAASDYANETIFKNLVLNRLAKPQEFGLLKIEIAKLRKIENAVWLGKLKLALIGPSSKDTRKKLKATEFPKDWLPQ